MFRTRKFSVKPPVAALLVLLAATAGFGIPARAAVGEKAFTAYGYAEKTAFLKAADETLSKWDDRLASLHENYRPADEAEKEHAGLLLRGLEARRVTAHNLREQLSRAGADRWEDLTDQFHRTIHEIEGLHEEVLRVIRFPDTRTNQ
jgi:hypothetical protein